MAISRPLWRPLPEDALRPEHEHDDQDPEDDRARPVAPRRPVEPLVQSLHAADHHCPQHRSGEVPDPAEHGRGERDQPELEARVVAHVELQEVDEPGDRGERARDEERHRDRPVDVDAHHRRGLRVLRDGPHRLPLPRRAYEPREQHEDRDDDEEHGQLVPRDDHAADVDGLRARDEVRHGLEVDAVDGEGDVLDDERHAHSRDQRRQPGRVAQRLGGDALDAGVDEREHRHRDRERHEQPDDDRRDTRALVQPEDGDDERAGDEPREREHVPVGEVDELEDPVDERVAKRHEPVDGAVRDADHHDVQEPGRVLEELDREPDDDRGKEDEPDDVDQARPTYALQSRRRRGHRRATLIAERWEGNALPPPSDVSSYDPPAAWTVSMFGENESLVVSSSVAMYIVKPTTAPDASTGSPFSLNLNEPRRPFVISVANIFSITELRLPSESAIASSTIWAAWPP